MGKIIIALLAFLLLTTACWPEEDPHGDPDEPLQFYSLTADAYTIAAGETTTLIADASGYMLSYFWSSTAGDILGSGAEVTYAPSPCQAGTNQITCRVEDGNGESRSKTITIVVQ